MNRGRESESSLEGVVDNGYHLRLHIIGSIDTTWTGPIGAGISGHWSISTNNLFYKHNSDIDVKSETCSRRHRRLRYKLGGRGRIFSMGRKSLGGNL